MNAIWKTQLAQKVLNYYRENAAEEAEQLIKHTLCVVNLTQLIAQEEGYTQTKIDLLILAAWLQKLGIPQALRLYGNALPAHTMKETRLLVQQWFKENEHLSPDEQHWIEEVVGNSYTFRPMLELGALPLQEADIIVNFLNDVHPRSLAQHYYNHHLHTPTGKQLFYNLFLTQTA